MHEPLPCGVANKALLKTRAQRQSKSKQPYRGRMKEFRIWRKEGPGGGVLKSINKGDPRHRTAENRKRRLLHQDRARSEPLLREELYRWFVAMRCSIYWNALDAQRRSRGTSKCIGRFPRRLLHVKVQQLLA